MKATLTFDLPDDDIEHLLALNGPKYWSALWGFNEALRRLRKNDLSLETVDQAWQDATEDIDWDEIP